MKAKNLLLASVFLLMVVGLVMSLSASGPQSMRLYGTPYHFFIHHSIFLLVGVFGAFLASRFDYHLWTRASPWIFLGSVALLLSVFAFPARNGARRWIELASLSFQASEVAKFALVSTLASWFAIIAPSSRKSHSGNSFRARIARKAAAPGWLPRYVYRLFIPGFLSLLLCGLVLLEPDFGTTVLLGATATAVMFVCGAPVAPLLFAFALAVVGISALVYFDPVRIARVISFMNPEAHPVAGYQLKNALYAFINGGFLGQGLGNSLQKILYLPEAHTDFIFAIIGEELGFCITIFVLALFAVFFFCGLRVSARASDPEGRILAFGISVLYALQALINIAVVVGVVPTKGLPLPFISYGGSSFIVTVCTIGVLYRIASDAEYPSRSPSR